MRVLVAEAHGKTARRLVRILTEDGHEVRGLVRKEEQMPDVEADGAEPVLVDLEEAEVEGAVRRAVEGCDAIVFAAGAGPGSGAARKETMDYGGAVKLIEAAQKNGVRRYLMLSSMGAGDPEGGSEAMQPYLIAKARADERLQMSDLDYTIIRPGGLTEEEGTGRIEATEHLGRRGEISRDDVAHTFAEALELENTYHKRYVTPPNTPALTLVATVVK
jgi:nucleoside-diphosphate-sugar epimerase